MLLIPVIVLILSAVLSGAFAAYRRQGRIRPGEVVTLKYHFPVGDSWSRVEGYGGEPCVAYRGGYFVAMERFQAPFFEDRKRSTERIRVSYVPANADALKENECAFGTSFETQANTWFAWKDGTPFVVLTLKRYGE